ncbi:MAG TPA: protein translocase subunit SecF [Actinobacteria bacterium]|nr:protein translocase subunit SecF [Actinomycetota bacterium]
MSILRQLYRGETAIDFVGLGRRTLVVSAVLVALAAATMLLRPFNLSIDFTGGTIVTAPNAAGARVDEVRAALRELGLGGAVVQITGNGGQGSILVRTEALPAADQDRLVEIVAGVAAVPLDEVNVDAVGPTFGAEVTRRALRALVIFLAVVAVFISWRFEWKMAVAALVALFHDLTMTGGIYALVGFLVTPATVIAVLTILGYSLYDTVVVFDKVVENVKETRGRVGFADIVNRSMNQVLMRSINTSLTSLLPVGSLLFVGSYALGAETLREFALALFIGIGVGTYSSIFVAAPLLALWKQREPEWQRVARRRAADEVPPPRRPRRVPAPAPASGAGPVAKPPKKRKKRR